MSLSNDSRSSQRLMHCRPDFKEDAAFPGSAHAPVVALSMRASRRIVSLRLGERLSTRNCSPRVAADRCQAVAGRGTTGGEPG